MNVRGGAQRSRSARPAAPVPPPTPLPAAATAVAPDITDETQSRVATSSDGGDHTAVQALLTNRTNPRLEPVQRLLKHVVSTVATVVRGTDSQRRFTSTYTGFCRTALRCMADLEEAVFEYTHPGRRAAEAADDEVGGIAEDVFLKQVSAYLASQTTSLGLAYLEHVALGELEKHRQQQRKRERTSSSSSTTASGKQRAAKASRRDAVSVAAGDIASCDSAFDSLGLIDAQDTARQAMSVLEQERSIAATTAAASSAGGADLKRRAPQAPTASVGKAYLGSHTAGLYVSKTSAPPGKGGNGGPWTGERAVFDLRNPQLKLTTVPELSALLQPWTTPLPFSGVALERVTMERERKGAPSSTTTTTTSSGPHASPEGASKTVLDVCLAHTPVELLRLYEAREAVLAAEPLPWVSTSPAIAAGPYSVVPYAGKRGALQGGSPRSTTAPAPPSPLAGLGGEPGSAAGDVDTMAQVMAEEDAIGASEFFPAVRENKMLTCLPQFVVSNQSHFGVSRMGFIYTMAPAPK